MEDKQMEKAVSRKLTLFCVICGLAVLVLMGATVIRDGEREWKHYQTQYREMLLKMIKKEDNPTFYQRVEEMKPEIRQIVVDEWKTVDRCTTCHLGIEDPLFANAKQPFTTHPNPELLKHHPVDKFGCTMCHGGQGLATTYNGSSHQPIDNWPITLVSKGLMQSRCGYCHKDFEAIKADRLIKGRELYKEMHCAGCHQIDGQGGNVGPDLSNFADKDPSNFSYESIEGPHSKQTWVIEHFRDPKRVSPGTPMRTYAMNDDQIECLASYVLSLTQRGFSRPYSTKVKADFVPHKVDEYVPEPELSDSADDAESN
ncbi:cytochrome c class I [Geobacter metallireducens RCH3]|nr:cytochrome c [Geobacter metallireducens]EHP86759.1 cytochrome c class I [Geobacter metallireducens RCH3]